jgi:hypothetical protein
VLTVQEDQKALAIMKLYCETQALAHLKSCTTIKEAYKTLQDNYEPDGFSTNHILVQEFLTLKP